jgi:deazaflavin-dependent oxidoreductase (nitroreductase family)
VPIPRVFARFNRKIANPLMRLVAGWLPPFAVVSHRGRVTGHDYATPVWAFGTGDGLVLALLYGAASDWVRNVLVAGRAEIRRSGTVRRYEQPRLVGEEGIRLIPAFFRVPIRLCQTRHFLRLTASHPDSRFGSGK